MDNNSTALESEVLLANFRLTEHFNNTRQSKISKISNDLQENISVLNDEGTKSKTNVAAMILISIASICICAIALTLKITFNLDYLLSVDHKMSILSLFDTFPDTLSLMQISQLMFAAHFLHLIWSVFAWKIFQFCSPSIHYKWYGNTPSSMIKLWTHASLFWLLLFSVFIAIQYMPNIGIFSIILFTSPLLTILIAYVYLHERSGYRSNKWLFMSVSLVVIALLLICQPNNIFSGATNKLSLFASIALLVVGIFCWSSICILLKSSMAEVQHGSIHWLQFEMVSGLLSCVLWLICVCIQSFVVSYSSGNSFASISVIFAYDWQLIMVAVFLMSVFMFGGIMCAVVGFQIGDVIKISCMQYSVFGACVAFAVYEQCMISVAEGGLHSVSLSVWLQLAGVGCLAIAGVMQVFMEYCMYLRKRKQARAIEHQFSSISNRDFFQRYYGSGKTDLYDARYPDSNGRQVLNDRMTIF